MDTRVVAIPFRLNATVRQSGSPAVRQSWGLGVYSVVIHGMNAADVESRCLSTSNEFSKLRTINASRMVNFL